MPEQENNAIQYQVGNVLFIVTPVYKETQQGESLAAILLKLMEADAQGVSKSLTSFTSAVRRGIL